MRIAIVKLGFRNLLLHKLRSFLTLLGMVLGVSSVIAMLAIGEGSKQEAIERIRQLGAANVIIRSIKPGSVPRTTKRVFRVRVSSRVRGCWSMVCSTATTTCSKATLPTVEKVVPIALIRKNAQHGRFRVANARVLGVTPAITRRSSASSSTAAVFLTPPDLHNTANVAVLERGPRNACSAMKIPSKNRCSWGRVRSA